MFKQIIVYDFSDDKLRTKIQRQIQDAGLARLQYSVYAGNIHPEMLNNLILSLDELIVTKKGDLRILYPCQHMKDAGIHTLVSTKELTQAEKLLARVYLPLR